MLLAEIAFTTNGISVVSFGTRQAPPIGVNNLSRLL